MKTLIYICTLLLSFNIFAFDEKFSFSSEESKKWSSYGEGIATYVSDEGRSAPGSLWLSNDFGEAITSFYQWDNLASGTYKVTFYVKLKDLQKGVDDVSFWHFYDGGEGTKSPFTNWTGTSKGWKKVQYTLNVTGKNLTIWFRLKSAGEVWVDDFSIEKTSTSMTLKVEEEASKARLKSLTNNSNIKSAKRTLLFNFEQKESGHPFSLKNGAGAFSPHQFYNFDLSKIKSKKWSEYDRVEMDVYNPNNEVADFYLTIGDYLSKDYWTQLNHKQLLAPGWNRISFALDQFVGERGSHRIYRSLDLDRLAKAFISIDQDQKKTFLKNEFLIDNIILSANPYPENPKSIKVFNFTSHKQKQLSNNIENVTSKTSYEEERGFGFINPQFWRIEDSVYASELNRYTIGILNGAFRVDLPNGKYRYQINVDKLGYWDVPFWSDRYLGVNGNPILLEKRENAKDFLKDLLQFENVAVKAEEHPYFVYRNKIFREINGEVTVSDGRVNFDFKGDATGITLNSLIIWKSEEQAVADKFLKSLVQRQKLEFDWMSRPLNRKNEEKRSNFLELIPANILLVPEKTIAEGKVKADILIGKNEKKTLFFQVKSSENKNVNLSLSDFKNGNGEKLNFEKATLYEIVNQYNSYDINHESYVISGKLLKPILKNTLALKKNEVKYFALEILSSNKATSGLYKGEIGVEKMKIDLGLDLRSYSLKALDFPVGFIGLDPLPFSYFKDSAFNKNVRSSYRMKALEKLLSDGFTTFSGLPIDPDELEKIFSLTQKFNVKTVFSYGGQFPEQLLNKNNKKSNQSDDDFYRVSSNELKKLLANKKWPTIVYTFSDEASGYSDKVAEDLKTAKLLKEKYPFLSIGGFGSFHSKDATNLNLSFDYGFYSGLSKSNVNNLKNADQKWGFYNAAAASFDDPRFTFGLGLYVSRAQGLAHYLEWNSSSFNNYPYYDFDGREADITNFYPSANGELFPSVKYVLATEGLNTYRKLKVLEEAVLDGASNKQLLESKKWIAGKLREYHFYSSPTPMTNRDFNSHAFEQELDERLKLHFK